MKPARFAQLTGVQIESGKDQADRGDQVLTWRGPGGVVLQTIEGGNYMVATLTPVQTIELAESLLGHARMLMGTKPYMEKEKK